MIHDPCIVSQLRSKKKESDDWFLLQIGCFNGDGEGSGEGGASDLGDAGEAVASDFVDPYDQDEAADFADRVSASTGVGGSSIGDNQTRAVNIATVASVPEVDFDEEADRNESPLNFAALSFPGGPNERRQQENEAAAALREYAKSRGEIEKQIEQQTQIDRMGRAVGADGPDPVDIFDSYDPDEPEGGAASLTAFRPDLARDPSRPPVSIVPAATTPAEQVISEARQTPADVMEQEVRQNLGGSAGDFEGLTAQQLGAAPGLGPTAMTGDVPIDAADIPESVPDPSSGLPRSIRSRGVTYGDEDFLPGGVVDQRLEGIAAARAAAAKSPLAQSPDLSGIKIGDVNIPLGPAGMLAQGIGAIGTDIYNTVANPTAKALSNLEDPNRYGAVYGNDGSLLGSVNRETGAVQPTEGNAFNPELEPYYEEARKRREEKSGDSSNQAPVAAVQPTMTAAPAPVPQASPMTVPAYQYQPRSPVQYSYTGIPTLAPVMLKPTFTAPERFSPLFNLGRTRRS